MGGIGKALTKAVGGGSKKAAAPVVKAAPMAEVVKPVQATRAEKLAASAGRASGGRGRRSLLGYNRFTDEQTTLGSS